MFNTEHVALQTFATSLNINFSPSKVVLHYFENLELKFFLGNIYSTVILVLNKIKQYINIISRVKRLHCGINLITNLYHRPGVKKYFSSHFLCRLVAAQHSVC